MNRIQEQVQFSKSEQQRINKIQKVQQHETLAFKNEMTFKLCDYLMQRPRSYLRAKPCKLTATHLYLKFSHVMQLIAMIKHALH